VSKRLESAIFLKKPIIPLLLALAFTLGPTCTGMGMEEDAPTDGDWLIRHIGAEPATLNPITSTDAYASLINSYLYETLIKRDEKTLELVPCLAESWEISEDHLTYVFHLKKGVHWQDGHPFTARDVLFSFERIRDPKVDSAHLRNYYQDIQNLEIHDDQTIRYTYRIPYFRALEFCGGIPIVPAHVFSEGDDFNNHLIGRSPVGNGPYRLMRWETGREIVLVRNEAYWGKRPHFDRIVLKIITDATAAFQVLKKGGLDHMSLRPIQWVRQTQSKRFNENYRKLKYYTPSYTYIGWNQRKPIFSDRRIRLAMTLMMDRETILKKILFGLGTVVSGSFYVNSPDYDQDLKPHPYDPARAMELLRAAGWEDHDGDGVVDREGVPFRFEFLLSSGSKFGEQVATILQENLKGVGILMDIRKLEWAVFIQRIDERDFDACTLGWSLSWESDPYQLWHSSQVEKGSNYVGFVNEEADRIIEAARREFDPVKRRDLYHRFHEIIHEEQPYTFLFTREELEAVSSRFRNVNLYPLGPEPREWWTPISLIRYREP
jgi:peptide/nickel transport system substrate-binding protein